MKQRETTERNLYFYLKTHDLGQHVKSQDSNEFHLFFSEEDLNFLRSRNEFFEGQEGGLIEGLDRNKKGGIFLLQKISENKYKYSGFLIPGFFVTSVKSFQHNKDEFSKLEKGYNEFEIYDYTNLRIPENCKKIDTEDKVFSFVLLSNYSQFIFTRKTVIDNLTRLVEIEEGY